LYRNLRLTLTCVAVTLASAWAGITYDLNGATLVQTNTGALITLFPAYDPTIVDPYTLTVTANGIEKAVASNQLSPGIFLDDQALFYGYPYNYVITIAYAATNYSVTRSLTLLSNSQMSNSSFYIGNLGPVQSRTLGTADARVIFPSNALASNMTFSFILITNSSVATYRFRGKAYMEYQLTDNDSNGTLLLPVSFRVKYFLQLTNTAFIAVPGFAGTNLHLTNRFDLSIATWDGRTWVPRNTFYELGPQYIALSALVSEEGNLGIVYKGWGNVNPNTEQAVVSSRLIVPVSTDPLFRNFHCTFQNESAEAVRFIIYDLRGRSIFESQSTLGTSVIWDGITKEGRLAPPGVYVYVLKIGTSDTRNYKGSFMVMGQ